MDHPRLVRQAVVILLACAVALTFALLQAQSAMAQSPSNVYVDDDYCSTCNNDGHIWGIDAFDKIQDGINAVAASGIVHVAAGSYAENLVINKSVEISGESQELVHLYPSFSNPDCRLGGTGPSCTGGGAASNILLVQSGTATVHDLEFNGNNPALTSGVVRNGEDIDARNGIIIGYHADLISLNNTIHNFYLNGIRSDPYFHGMLIYDNTISNIRGEFSSAAISKNGFGYIEIDQNLIFDASYGVWASTDGIVLTSNEIYNSGSGIYVQNMEDSSFQVDIEVNYIHDCLEYDELDSGVGIWVENSDYVWASDNRVVNCLAGIVSRGNEWLDIYRNYVDGAGLPYSTGFSHFAFLSDGSPSESFANFEGNIVINNDASIYLSAETNFSIWSQIRNNIIVNNPTGVVLTGSGEFQVDAEDNWWGCNAGPGNPGCDPIDPRVDANPWMLLTATAEPGIIPTGGTSTITASILWNSDGEKRLPLRDGQMATFASDPLGTMDPLSGLLVRGQASSTFTAGLFSGVAHPSVIVDHQTVTTTVYVNIPAVSLNSTSYTISEGSGTAIITANLSITPTLETTVDFDAVPGSATIADFVPISGTLTFQPGQRTATFEVTILEDTIDEPEEAAHIELSNPINSYLGNPSTATLGIVDNDPMPTIYYTLSNFTVDENGWLATITIELSEESGYPIWFDYNTYDGTAGSADYVPTSGEITFNPGDRVASLTIEILDDSLDEPNETVNLHLSNPFNATVGPDATLTIVDDDPPPDIIFSDPSFEVNETAGSAIITATLSQESVFEITVVYTASAGTASIIDFTPVSGLLFFYPGETTASFEVAIKNDLLDEPDETVILTLGDAEHAVPGPDATLTILDNDASPAVQLSAASFTTLEDAGLAVITVMLDAPSGCEVSVDYSASDGTANGDDYTPVSGAITFAPGETQAVFEVPMSADDQLEPDETVLIVLSNPLQAVPGEIMTGVLTLVNDDDMPVVSFSSASYSVSESGGTAAITITLSSMSAYTVTVDFETLAGTAGLGDFTPIAGTLTFAPGQTTMTFNVAITSDGIDEPDETIFLHLSNPVNATAGADAILTILDDDLTYRLFLPIVMKY